MNDREKLIELLGGDMCKDCCCYDCEYENDDRGCIEHIKQNMADHLLANGVTFATDNNDGCKRIEELKAQLVEREKVVIQLRKQWQDAEMHICTMCGHFDHKTDGNIVYGNQTCGEICGYPFCKEKFTPWIPVSERLPDPFVVVYVYDCTMKMVTDAYMTRNKEWVGVHMNHEVTQWMPLPEPPKE